jgi:two-component system OmpR family response regulator
VQPFDRSIDNQISRLRRKIERDPRNPSLIKTAWGDGYNFAGEVQRR